jgi:hypothetical protein
MFMVVEGSDRLVGCVTTKQVKEIAKSGAKKVGEIAARVRRKYHSSSCRRHEGPVDYEKQVPAVLYDRGNV